MSDPASSVLVLSGIGVPPYSARGLTQTLEPIDAAKQQRRTVNGVLMDLSYDQFHKFKSTITGNDQDPPAVDMAMPGKLITVSCITELCYDASYVSEPSRPSVYQSERVDQYPYIFYRPQLSMMVTGFSIERDEWGAQVSWTLNLEEV
ncbi:MAG TPA: hypothetical protein VH678_15015 [Xanthobacteraceae bacterium]|jgi:hypothetical protein